MAAPGALSPSATEFAQNPARASSIVAPKRE
jgi:hypothetical protein